MHLYSQVRIGFTGLLSSVSLLTVVYLSYGSIFTKELQSKRNPMVAEDNIIIRANLIRHIIFRNLQVCLMKYLVSVTVGPRESNVNDASISTFQCVQKYNVPI